MTSRVFTCSAFSLAAVTAAAVLSLSEPVYTHKPITTNILFKNEIAQIFQRKCFQCHSENNLSMSLTTYTEARPWARAIREEILERSMPPWQAVPGYGHFANDLSLNTREKEIILSWADGGAPSGVLKAEESIAPVYVPTEPAWDHGTPDLIVAIGSGEKVAAGAPFALRRVVVTTKLPAMKRVRALALKQGDRRVVRHAAFYEEKSGRWLGAWTPWQTVSTLPSDAAVQLPAQTRLIVEIGYSGTDIDVTDKSELGLYFADARAAIAEAAVVTTAETSMPAGAAAVRVRGEAVLKADTSVLALWPNPVPGATSIELTASTPDGIVTPLLWIQDYREEWRSPYVLAQPVTLPRGTRLALTAYFDNPTETAQAAKIDVRMLSTARLTGPSQPRSR